MKKYMKINQLKVKMRDGYIKTMTEWTNNIKL